MTWGQSGQCDPETKVGMPARVDGVTLTGWDSGGVLVSADCPLDKI